MKVEGLVESVANKALVNNLAAWPTEVKAETLREFWQLDRDTKRQRQRH